MPQSNPLPPLWRNDAVETMEEFPQEGFPHNAYNAVTPIQPATNPPAHIFTRPTTPTGQLAGTAEQATSAFSPASYAAPGEQRGQTGQPSYFPFQSGPLHDIPTTQSLITSLPGTMRPTRSVAKPVVVIPGNKKRTQLLPETVNPPTPPRRMSRRLRHGIALGAILFVLTLTFASLAPLDNGQSSFQRIGGVIEFVRTQRQDWTIAAHNLQQDNPQDTQNVTGNNSPGGGATPSAPLTMYLPASQYIAIARQDAIDAGIPPDYFIRQINLESGFNPNTVSPYGAVGIAQFLPGTAAGLGVNPWDPISSLQGAANLMASSSRQYGGSYAMALAAYNAGSGTVDYAVKNCGANWMSCLPGETRNYLQVIMGI